MRAKRWTYLMASRHVPQPYGAVVAAGGQDLAVWAERHGRDCACRSGEEVAGVGLDVPESCRAVNGDNGQGRAVRAESHGGHRVPGIERLARWPVRRGVPDPDRAIVIAGGEDFAVGAECHGPDRVADAK